MVFVLWLWMKSRIGINQKTEKDQVAGLLVDARGLVLLCLVPSAELSSHSSYWQAQLLPGTSPDVSGSLAQTSQFHSCW